MFDDIKVLVELPLNEELKALDIKWDEEIFQTKDLENLLDLYEIRGDRKLYHLQQETEWEKNEDHFLGGHLKVISESWEVVPYHGTIRFYTGYCDLKDLDKEPICGGREKTWDEIFNTQGFDWWIEFIATFDNGTCRQIRLDKIEKNPISIRLAHNKEWALKNEMKQKQLSNRIISKLRKIPSYRKVTKALYRGEQNLHTCLNKFLIKIL